MKTCYIDEYIYIIRCDLSSGFFYTISDKFTLTFFDFRCIIYTENNILYLEG